MFQHHSIATELADLRRRELFAEAAQSRRVPRDRSRTNRVLRRR